MSRYDGLIIPRSYSEYINKTDAATLLQALQLSGVMDNAPTSGSNHPVKSSGIYNEIKKLYFSNATQLTSTNDLNNIKTEGLYFCNGAVLPQNAPSGTAANLYNCLIKVTKQGTANRYVQEFYTLNGNAKYTRTCGVAAADTWSTWEKVLTKNDIANTIMEYWNIFTAQEITETTATTKNTYASRKFSDYGQLMFILGASGTDYRQTIIIPRSKFSGNAAIVLRAYSGNNYVELFITYNDDTSFKVYKSGTAFAPYLAILGYGGLNI